MLDAVRSIGLALVQIVLTHWHPDHAGGAAALAAYTGASVCTGRADADVIRGDRMGDPAVLTATEEPIMADIASHVTPAPPCPVDRELDEGDTIAAPNPADGQAAVVVAVPGHTPGSIALHLPAERLILTGDIAVNRGGQVSLGPFNTDREQAKRSLRRLTALDVDAVGFGHGDPITKDANAALATWTDLFA